MLLPFGRRKTSHHRCRMFNTFSSLSSGGPPSLLQVRSKRKVHVSPSLTSRSATVALLPYAIFSLFHALTFTRTTLMPQFLPPGQPATAGGAPQPHPLAKKLQAWVKGYSAKQFSWSNATKFYLYSQL